MRKWIAILGAAAFCGLCASPSASESKAPVATAEGRERIISTIHQRHRVITIRAGDAGPTYTLETPNGAVLVRDMTLGEMAQKKPEMYQQVQSMQSGLLWAGE